MFLENIPYQYYLLAFGVILLIKGGDWFVDAATGIARRFKLPELLIGATVVSIGTTLPEVLTSAMAAASNNAATAYGNAIGSIICNTSLIAAITIAIKPAKADKKTLIFPVSFFFGAAVFYSFCAYYFKSFPHWTGILLLVGFVVYMVINVLNMKKNPDEQELTGIEEHSDDATEQGAGSLSFVKDIGMLIVSAAVIAVGAHLLGDNAKWLAEVQLGIPGEIVSLTIVALATSLPELVTAITALAKGHGALSLGNIIGANIFNLVLVSGAAITIAPFDIPSGTQIMGQSASLLIDVPLVFITMGIMTIPTIIKGKLQRWQGISLLAIYFSYVVFQVVMALAFAG